MVAEECNAGAEDTHTAGTAHALQPCVSQQGRSAGCLGTGPCSNRLAVQVQQVSSRTGPAPSANPLPDQARRATFLRANPYSEVTDRFCRLPLPTLFYTTRGSSPRRPDADMSTTWRETSRGPLPDFHGPRERLRTPQQLRCSPRSAPYLPARGFQAATTLIQKR